MFIEFLECPQDSADHGITCKITNPSLSTLTHVHTHTLTPVLTHIHVSHTLHAAACHTSLPVPFPPHERLPQSSSLSGDFFSFTGLYWCHWGTSLPGPGFLCSAISAFTFPLRLHIGASWSRDRLVRGCLDGPDTLVAFMVLVWRLPYTAMSFCFPFTSSLLSRLMGWQVPFHRSELSLAVGLPEGLWSRCVSEHFRP